MEPRISAAMVARSRTLAEPRWSPSGRRIAWVDAFAARVDLVVAAVDRSLPPVVLTADVPATPVGNYGGGAFAWAHDDQLVYAGADGALYVVGAEGGRPRRLTRDGRAFAPAVSPDATLVACAVERDDSCDIAVVPLDGSAWPMRVSRDSDYAWDPAWSPDRRALAWHEWDLPNMPWDGSRIAIASIDGATVGLARVVAGGDDESVGQPRFAPDGARLGFVSDRTGWTNVWTARPDGRDARPALEESCEHAEPSWGPGQRSFAWSVDGRQVAVCRNESGFGRLVSLPTSGAEPALEARLLSTGWHHGLDWGTQGVVCIRSAPRAPAAVVIAPPSGGDACPFAFAAVGGFDASSLVEPEPVTWPGDDGAPVHGLRYTPRWSALGPGRSPPLLVVIHGGPTGQAAAAWAPRVQFWLDRGWAVLAPNYRGSTGYGRAYAQALAGRWGELDVADTAAGIRHAGREGWADPSRVAVIGGSAGGLTVYLLAVWHGDLVRAGVSLYGVADLFELADTTHRFESRYLDRIVGDLPAEASRYRERSPVTRADRIRTPLLVLQGRDDKVVPAAQAEVMVEAIRRAGAPVEHHTYDGEGHGWTRPETILDELGRTERFLTKWVLRR